MTNKQPIKIFRRVYDNPKKEDGSLKPNELLGEFTLIEGNMDDYMYIVYLQDKEGELYKLQGVEVSGLYHPKEGGTRHILTKLKDDPTVQIYLKYLKQ